MEGEDVPGKLFLGGLSPETTTKTIQAYFSQFGDITDAVAMWKDGRPRGFGFVTFADSLAAQIVLEHPHDLDGKRIDVKACSLEGTAGIPARLGGDAALEEQRPQQSGTTQQVRQTPSEEGKIFVGGLGNCSEEEFRAYFEAYGELVDCVVMREKDTGRPRGFGFIKFLEPAAAAIVMEDAGVHVIGGRSVEVKWTVPREQAAQPRQPMQQQVPQPVQQQVPVWQAPVHQPMFEEKTRPLSDSSNKMFVGGIGSMSTDELQAYFGQYGNLIDVIAMTNKATGEPRGFGFVKFDNADSVAAVLQDYEHHKLNGKWMEVKLCTPKDGDGGGMPMEAAQPQDDFDAFYAAAAAEYYSTPKAQTPRMQFPPIARAQIPRPSSKPLSLPAAQWSGAASFPRNGAAAAPPRQDPAALKVFVGGLGRDVEDDIFTMYFQKYGNITDSVVMRNKGTGEPRGFGFVSFDDPASVEAVMDDADKHQLNGKRVEVKRCVPKDQMATATMEPAGMPGPAHHSMPVSMPAFAAFENTLQAVMAPAPRHYVPAAQAAPVRIQQQLRPAPAPVPATGESCKLFVGGIGACPEDVFVAYFETYGNLVDAVVMKDKGSGQPRGFGFVKYDNLDSANAVLEDFANHQLNGKWIEVKRVDGAKGSSKGAAPAKGYGKGKSDMGKSDYGVTLGALHSGYRPAPY